MAPGMRHELNQKAIQREVRRLLWPNMSTTPTNYMQGTQYEKDTRYILPTAGAIRASSRLN